MTSLLSGLRAGDEVSRHRSGAVMLGGIGIAATRMFLVLVWTTAVSAVATVVLYKLHFKGASKIAGVLASFSWPSPYGHTLPSGDLFGSASHDSEGL